MQSSYSLIKNLFDETQSILKNYFQKIDYKKVHEVLEKILACRGNIIFTGVGKSAFIAQKIAATMLSTGTKALFIPALDALHGDIAVLSENDIFILFSKSGNTEELIDLITYARQKKAFIISVVSNEQSQLFEKADLSIYLPIDKELCPFNLAPTSSTTAQLIFGDVLTVALMKVKNFSLDEYAYNHPAGTIGKKITLKVKDLMIKGDDLPVCPSDVRILDVLHELSAKRCGCVLIADENKRLFGIFTDGDLRRGMQKEKEHFFEKKISDFMTASPKIAHPDMLAVQALQCMQKEKLITSLPVIENGKLMGLLRMHDIIKAGLVG